MATKTEQKNTGNNSPSRKRTLTGKVVSNKMKDTVVILIERYEKHPKYQKFQKISKRFKAHDAGNTMNMGDTVRIEECAPISKDKHFKVVEKVASAKAAVIDMASEAMDEAEMAAE